MNEKLSDKIETEVTKKTVAAATQITILDAVRILKHLFVK